MAAVVIDMTLDLVMATSLSRGSLAATCSPSALAVSCSEVVLLFSFLKLFDFSSRLASIESELFLDK